MGFSIFLAVSGKTSPLWLCATWVVYASMAMINSAGFHRLFAHRSYQTNRFWNWFLLIFGTLTCYGSSIQWTVVHTIHHKYSDTSLDPHQFRTIWDVFRSNYASTVAPDGFKIIERSRYARHLVKHRGHAWIHRHYWLLPISFFCFLLMLSWKIALYCYLAPIGLVIFSAAFFNYVSHIGGAPHNYSFFALLPSGEGRHKLHHDEPWRWDLRERWYHPDPVALFIKAIKR